MVTPDGQWAISGSLSTLKVWDIQRGVELHTLKGHTDWVRQVVVTPDGRRAISASDDCTLKVWDIVGHNCGDEELAACAIAPDGLKIVAGEQSGRVHFLNLEGSW